MNGAERREFVRRHRTCVFSYPRKKHGPSLSCVYYVMDGDDILVSSMMGRAKPKAVLRDGRVSLCVLDEKWPPTYVTVFGRATVEEQGGGDLLIAICELMAEQPMPEGERAKLRGRPLRHPGEARVHLRDSAASRLRSEGCRRATYGNTLPWDAD